MQEQTEIQRAPGAVQAVVDDQLVLLSPIDFSYHAVDPVGARIWEILEQPHTIDQIVATLTTLYSVDPDTCRTDVEPFIDRMVEIGVLTPTQ